MIPSMDMDEMENLVAKFAAASYRHYTYTVEGAGKRKVNGEADIVAQCYKALAAAGAKDKLLSLLDDPHPAAVAMTATYCMHFAPEPCRAALRRVARAPGLIGMMAEYALGRFTDGSWVREVS